MAFHYAADNTAPNACGAPVRQSEWIEEWAAVTCHACLATEHGINYLLEAYRPKDKPAEPADTMPPGEFVRSY